MPTKSKRLEAADPARAEAARRWQAAASMADETGRASDHADASVQNPILIAADRKTKKIESGP